MQKTLARHKNRDGDIVIPRRDIMSDSATVKHLEHFGYGFEVRPVGGSVLVKADCFEWLKRVPENSLHGIVTDPPYGVKEYDEDQLKKREDGRGGVWRIFSCCHNCLRALSRGVDFNFVTIGTEKGHIFSGSLPNR